jgi:hypothetical protein
MKVEKIDGDKKKLLKSLMIFIPADMLSNNRFEKLIKTLANKFFKINYQMIS